METFLLNPNIDVQKADMEQMHELFKEQLRIRYSSPLFRLETAEDIHRRVTYHNTGPDQVPGLIVMTISDGVCAGEPMDSNLDGIVVLFNSAPDERSFDTGINGLQLHPKILDSVDDNLGSAHVIGSRVSVPAISAVVFVKPTLNGQGEFPCNNRFESLY